MTKKQIQWTVGILGSIAALALAVIQLWPMVGWTTPNQHIADIDRIIAERMVSEEAIINAIDRVLEKQDEGRDEWKCDEYEEELVDALKAQEDDGDTVEIRRLIEKIKDKMDDLNCSRFEDFG